VCEVHENASFMSRSCCCGAKATVPRAAGTALLVLCFTSTRKLEAAIMLCNVLLGTGNCT
jgi:hypothetical protein